MIFGSTKTKLDYILELGIKRIGEAVEAVIDNYPPIVIEEPCPILSNQAERGRLQSSADMGARSKRFDNFLDYVQTGQSALLNNQSALGGLGSGSLFNQLVTSHSALGRIM